MRESDNFDGNNGHGRALAATGAPGPAGLDPVPVVERDEDTAHDETKR